MSEQDRRMHRVCRASSGDRQEASHEAVSGAVTEGVSVALSARVEQSGRRTGRGREANRKTTVEHCCSSISGPQVLQEAHVMRMACAPPC